MKKFEYKIASVLREKVEVILEQLGEAGWELCGVIFEDGALETTAHLFFKREKIIE